MIHIPFEWNKLPDTNYYNFQIVNNYNENMFENSLILDTLINDITFVDTECLGPGIMIIGGELGHNIMMVVLVNGVLFLVLESEVKSLLKLMQIF